MYEQKYGKISKGMCACHKCDNPARINPEHIFIGTNKYNLMDMSKKKRSGGGVSKKFKATRISDNYNEISNNQHEFARKYDLNVSHINSCLRGKIININTKDKEYLITRLTQIGELSDRIGKIINPDRTCPTIGAKKFS